MFWAKSLLVCSSAFVFMPIEVELRSFISKQKYDELLLFFKNNAEYCGEDDQETFYFDAAEDVRIQRNNTFSKIWMKKGKIHDEQREELEIKFAISDFEKLESLFLSLGFNIKEQHGNNLVFVRA